jgi:CBS domain-containing protein/sporulation protein YlmC with PRC-barrel domain
MTSQVTFYLSRILGKRFYSPDGKVIGKIKDLLIDISYSRPKVIGVKTKIAGETRYLDFSYFEMIKADIKYVVKCANVIDFTLPNNSHTFFLSENVLDKQIVDIDGRKLVRVNDARLVLVPSGAFLIAVDVGLEGLLRRIGISRPIKRFLLLFRLSLPSKYILWDDVATVDSQSAGLRLSTTYSKLHTLHPSDLADIIEDMDRTTRTKVLANLDEEKAADVLEELETKSQIHIIENLSTEKAADLLEKMPADEAADIIDELEPQKAEELLNEMEVESSEDVRDLLEYSENTVGSIMSTDFISFNKNVTTGEAIQELRKQKPEADTLYSVLVVDEKERLIATVTLRDLIVSDPSTRLSQIMQKQIITVFDDDKIDSLAEVISKYNLLAIPVIDSSSKIQGLVMIDDIIEDLLENRKTK